MGEYVKLDGEHVKLGTCEDLYYTTYAQLEAQVRRMERAPGNADPGDYLDWQHGFRYRFPFPDEDGMAIGSHHDYARGLLIGVPRDSVAVHDRHDPARPQIRAGAYRGERWDGFDVQLAGTVCPADPNSPRLPPPGRCPVELCQQRVMEDGALWVVLACGWCGSKYRLGPEEGLWLAEYLRDHPQPGQVPSYWREVALRIVRGYRAGQPEAQEPEGGAG